MRAAARTDGVVKDLNRSIRGPYLKRGVAVQRYWCCSLLLPWWLVIDGDGERGEVLGGTAGGIPRSQLPGTVADVVEECRHEAIDIRIRPEHVPDREASAEYLVEWRYLEYDDGSLAWKPVKEHRPGDETER